MGGARLSQAMGGCLWEAFGGPSQALGVKEGP